VKGVYDRHHYDDQKAEALKQLAGLVETILNPPKFAISVPSTSGPRKVRKRGTLVLSAISVARTRVGNNSGIDAGLGKGRGLCISNEPT